jgi:hypothetical protein
MAARATAARTRTINIRIEEERRTLIDRAAEAAGKDRTQFVLDAATAEKPRLRKLLSRKGPGSDECARKSQFRPTRV